MYNRDNKMIQKYTDQGPTQTAMAAMFAITSIKTKTFLLPDMLDSYRDEGAKTLKNVMSKQIEGINYVMKKKEWLYNLVQSYKAGDIYPEELLLSLQSIPSIGLVKAGFIMQLTTGEAGCFDCHNLKEYSLNENTFKVNGKDKGKITAANFNKARKYLAVCKEIGGSEVLWNNWCNLIAEKYPNHFESADDVSWLHSNSIMGIHQTIARAQTMEQFLVRNKESKLAIGLFHTDEPEHLADLIDEFCNYHDLEYKILDYPINFLMPDFIIPEKKTEGKWDDETLEELNERSIKQASLEVSENYWNIFHNEDADDEWYDVPTEGAFLETLFASRATQ